MEYHNQRVSFIAYNGIRHEQPVLQRLLIMCREVSRNFGLFLIGF